MKSAPLLALLLAVGMADAAAAPSGLTLYVAPGGDDSATGRSAKTPFASLGRARDEVRKLKAGTGLPPGGVTVEIAPGIFNLEESLAFDEGDSGTKASPIIYRGQPGAGTRLLGGRVVKLAEFAPVTDPALVARLDPAARGKVVAAPIAKLGLQHAGPFPPVFSDSGGIFELFWNGTRLPLSRWPNEGATTMKTVVTVGDKNTPGVFEYRDDRAARWLQNPSVWLKGQWRVGWEDPAIRVAKIDPATKTITFAAGIQNGIGNKYTRPAGNGQEPWFAINLVEEIDRPGEWAIDFDSGTLFLWPPAGEGELMVSQLDEPLVTLKDTAHLAFERIVFECSLGDGIVAENTESFRVAGCTFRNLARRGMAILGGHRALVQSNDFYFLGEGCVYVTGGNRLTLERSEHQIVNNHMHHYGVLKSQYSAALDVGCNGNPAMRKGGDAVGIRAAHNLIHDAPRDAFLYGGQDNVFEFNEITRCGFGTADVGAFYSWLDWTIRGIVIRYNFIHKTVGGVNPDDGAAGNTVFGNIFVGPRTGVYIASGPDNTIENNIFVKDEGPVFGMDDRGVGRKYATNARLIALVESVKADQDPWASRFPELKGMLENRPELPWRTKVARNLIVMKTGEPYKLNITPASKAMPGLFTWEDNLVTADDPGFVNPAANNYALKPTSPVFKEIPGFQPIPFDKIGLQIDAFRPTLPDAPGSASPTPTPATQNTGESFGT